MTSYTERFAWLQRLDENLPEPEVIRVDSRGIDISIKPEYAELWLAALIKVEGLPSDYREGGTSDYSMQHWYWGTRPLSWLMLTAIEKRAAEAVA